MGKCDPNKWSERIGGRRTRGRLFLILLPYMDKCSTSQAQEMDELSLPKYRKMPSQYAAALGQFSQRYTWINMLPAAYNAVRTLGRASAGGINCLKTQSGRCSKVRIAGTSFALTGFRSIVWPWNCFLLCL